MSTSNNLYNFSSLSDITKSDQDLLKQAVLRLRPDSMYYEDCWGYIIQATRYGGCKWYDPVSQSLIFFGRKSIDDPTLVVPVFFAEPSYLVRVLSLVKRRLSVSKVILKNTNVADVALFSSYGFRTYTKEERWNNDAPFDDQTYPQQIVNLTYLALLQGSRYHNLRRQLRKFSNVSIRKYDAKDSEDVLRLFALKDGKRKAILGEKSGMYFESHVMYPGADINKFVIIDNDNGEILGFTAVSDISAKNTSLVASLFKPGVKVASIWGIYQTLMLKHKDGFLFANIGGAEAEGTYNFFKGNFGPVKEISKTHLVYDC